uniref:Uncharacterized protein n=1 Tax=Anguilla anguilla TaxID=7936 RepID=A0A0E9U990_ANGAN
MLLELKNRVTFSTTPIEVQILFSIFHQLDDIQLKAESAYSMSC